MRDADNIREVEKLGIDMMGFIFWEKSNRYVGAEPPAYLPVRCKRVGVFVDAQPLAVVEIARRFQLDYIQFHGTESTCYISEVRNMMRVLNPNIKIIKAMSIFDRGDLLKTEPYEGICDMLLFDTKGKLPGGNGSRFDWNVLQHYHGNLPFLLSGGIAPNDASQINEFHHPMFAGIDLNSKFEISPGIKDIVKLKSFKDAILLHKRGLL